MSGATNTLSYVISNKKINNQKRNISAKERILQLLGMSADQVKNDLTLPNIGVDSLQMVEIHGILKQYGITKSLAELGKMQWVDIMNLARN
jgi:aryl carrier-like protein